MTHPRELAEEGRALARSMQHKGMRREAQLVRALADRVEHLHEARAHAG